jgi:hypothetical protein
MATASSRGSSATTTGSTWASTTNAYDGAVGTNPATYAVFTSAAASAVGTITIGGYSFGLTGAETITAVSMAVRHVESSPNRYVALTCQLQDSTGANIGTAQAVTLGTTAATITVSPSALPTAAQVAAGLRVLISVTHSTGVFSGTFSLDQVDVSVTYTAPGLINYVQGNFSTPANGTNPVTPAFTGAQTAGNLNVVIVGWNDNTSTISSVTDTKGNTYHLAVPVARNATAPGLSQAIYYAANIVAATAGANTVTVTWNTAPNAADVRIAEYSGCATSNPFDVGTSGSGTGTTASAGPITTTAANEVLVGAGMTQGILTAGTGYTSRIVTTGSNAVGDILEDEIVTSINNYSATATQASGPWVFQIAAFSVTSIGSAPTPTNQFFAMF